MNVLNATRACSMLFSVMARSSGGTSKWGIPSLALFMADTFSEKTRSRDLQRHCGTADGKMLPWFYSAEQMIASRSSGFALRAAGTILPVKVSGR
jgi:hypothetical protein